MGAVVASMDRLRDEFKCHVCCIHHFGKDSGRGPRGHSLLEANLDTVIEVQRDKTRKISTATVTKQRDGELGKAISFRLRSIELGRDEDGDPVTSCVVERADDQTHHMPAELVEKEKLTRGEGLALQAMTNAINIGGTVPPASNHIPRQIRCVSEALWRDYCRNGAISKGGDRAERKAFKNACRRAPGQEPDRQMGRLGMAEVASHGGTFRNFLVLCSDNSRCLCARLWRNFPEPESLDSVPKGSAHNTRAAEIKDPPCTPAKHMR